ncbi:MAG TPA: TlpA disulfide reductase family protein [Acidimicrobiales bacterium]|nr:TlpA disulfide reductase family protein [Acidimicrobiales bacterium]
MRRLHWLRCLAGASALAMVLSSCGQATGLASRSAPAAPAVRSAQAQPAPAKASTSETVPFEVTTLEGGNFAVSGAPGRPVVLYFMAAWCISCLPEAKALATVQEKYQDHNVDVLVLDVDPSDTPADLQAFKEAAGLAKHWAFDVEGRVTKAYQVQALDSTIVIAPDGRIVYRDGRPTSLEILDKAVAQALQ